jgi:methylthioribose-1-phosphate isomerase
VLAHHHGIPFYTVSPRSTIDTNVPTADQIPVEQRDPDEVRCINDTLITMPDANVLNYAFDVTPHDLITAIVTEYGIIRPPFVEGIASIFR